jgi:hypothetical protein
VANRRWLAGKARRSGLMSFPAERTAVPALDRPAAVEAGRLPPAARWWALADIAGTCGSCVPY